MQTISNDFKSAILSPVRKVNAKVELYNGSTLANTFTQDDKLISIEIQRIGESGKFFGFAICQRLNVHLIDTERKLSISTANMLKPYIGVGTEYCNFPSFHVTEVNRDENTNELSITAYDLMSKAKNYTFSELTLTKSYTIMNVANAIAAALQSEIVAEVPAGDTSFKVTYPNGANFEVDEEGNITDKTNLRDVITYIAEATQTICFINSDDKIVFKRLLKDGSSKLTLDKASYFSLSSKANKRLQTIIRANELGDNVSAGTTQIGSTQIINNNPFWDNREDIITLLDKAITRMGDMTFNLFSVEWRGNPALELGDKIKIINKDNSEVISYLLNDTITYKGTLSEKTELKWEDSTESTDAQPTTLPELIKKTYAKVDRVNNTIEMVVSDTKEVTNSLGELDEKVDGVKKTADNAAAGITSINTEITSIKSTSEDIKLSVKKIQDDGVSKIETGMGYTFDDEGLHIEKTGSELSTHIDEDGMEVKKNDETMLKADNQGVDAKNLHANTYLIIGGNSRFEDYTKAGNSYTACFWIGGVS